MYYFSRPLFLFLAFSCFLGLLPSNKKAQNKQGAIIEEKEKDNSGALVSGVVVKEEKIKALKVEELEKQYSSASKEDCKNIIKSAKLELSKHYIRTKRKNRDTIDLRIYDRDKIRILSNLKQGQVLNPALHFVGDRPLLFRLHLLIARCHEKKEGEESRALAHYRSSLLYSKTPISLSPENTSEELAQKRNETKVKRARLFFNMAILSKKIEKKNLYRETNKTKEDFNWLIAKANREKVLKKDVGDNYIYYLHKAHQLEESNQDYLRLLAKAYNQKRELSQALFFTEKYLSTLKNTTESTDTSRPSRPSQKMKRNQEEFILLAAKLKSEVGRYLEAAIYYEKFLRLAKDEQGKSKKEVNFQMLSLANLYYQKLGKYAKAKFLYENYLLSDSEKNQKVSTDVITLKDKKDLEKFSDLYRVNFRLGEIYKKEKRSKKSRERFLKAKEIYAAFLKEKDILTNDINRLTRETNYLQSELSTEEKNPKSPLLAEKKDLYYKITQKEIPRKKEILRIIQGKISVLKYLK